MTRHRPSPDQPILPFDVARFSKVAVTKGKKHRETWMPEPEIAEQLRRFLQRLYRLDLAMPHATGAIPRIGLIDNVQPHKHNLHFYCIDITDAFGSVDQASLHDTIVSFADQSQQATLDEQLDDFIFVPDVPGLPLGLLTSPYLFNIYCRELDAVLGSTCEENDITYTRYLDDLTFSSMTPIKKSVRQAIREAVEQVSGFTINHGKSKLHQRITKPVTITGISIYPDGRIQPSPQLIGKMAAAIIDIDERVASGKLVGDHDLGVLNGWNSVLETARDKEAPLTPKYRELRRLYEATHERVLRALGYSTAKLEWKQDSQIMFSQAFEDDIPETW